MRITDRTESARAEAGPRHPAVEPDTYDASYGEPNQAGGSHDLLGGLYAEHRSQALKFARSLTSCPGQAEDLVSEAFLRMWLRIRSGVVIDHPRAYLVTSIRNLSIDMARRTSKEQYVEDPEPVQPGPAHAAPADEIDSAIQRIDIQRALSAMAPAHSRVLVWTLIEGLSNAEAASRMGSDPNTMSSLAYRARRALAGHLRTPASPASRGPAARRQQSGEAALSQASFARP